MNSHLDDVKESYITHLKFTFCANWYLIKILYFSIIHGFLPQVYIKRAEIEFFKLLDIVNQKNESRKIK
jgi:hypothetical protein